MSLESGGLGSCTSLQRPRMVVEKSSHTLPNLRLETLDDCPWVFEGLMVDLSHPLRPAGHAAVVAFVMTQTLARPVVVAAWVPLRRRRELPLTWRLSRRLGSGIPD